ncbi:ABC transporter substrate-binding protein [Novosphingobium flavum]|uniref:ABC transporter substrate-binding protein n=1 Tax=Novosphingobium flavum TaxID=1778672 RepID=A0A7X1KLA8_9SPHN|nr:ABC transporter substrate-binding protein [Novosphingobium flavum]MBC2665382.1 ABC transporter substrate-binding protein [Novosphingobium flavum]
MFEMISRRALMGQFGAAGLLTLSGCSGQQGSAKGAINIATAAGSFNMTIAALMKQQGFMESLGLHPNAIAVSDGAKILASVVSGSVDIAPLSGFSQIFPAIERGAQVRILSAATLTPMLALFSGKPGVRTLKDLEGKNVGSGAMGSLVHQLTVTLLRKYGIDVSTIRFINLGSNTDVFKGVMAGTVDAGLGPASYVPDAEIYKVHALEHGDMSVELPDFTYQAGWTSTHAIATKRDELVRTLAAYATLFRFLGQPEAKEAFLKARRSVFPSAPEREHESEWAFLQKTKPLAKDLIISPERVEYMQKINVEFKAQKEVLPYDRVVDTSIAEAALKLLDKT